MNILKAVALPDILSLSNAIFGFLALMAGSRGQVSLSITLLIFSMAVDGLDGCLARRMGSGPLGKNLDSFADLISFGVAPPVLALSAFDLPPSFWAAGGLYLLCGTLRLARFNLTVNNSRFFEGLPIPAAGIMVAASVPLMRPELTMLLLLLLSVLMLASIPYPKVSSYKAVLLLGAAVLAAAYMLFLGSLSGYAAVLAAASLAYILSPVVIKYPKIER
ncbi:MAG: CDP-diacylglycerol--serine O-phosphatidyltransferase [Methanotrichaceae archaeon]|nr:CDP-diacylglycerol--serine O-phosphatidyltransferase [Methanotrichaceae archaeon]